MLKRFVSNRRRLTGHVITALTCFLSTAALPRLALADSAYIAQAGSPIASSFSSTPVFGKLIDQFHPPKLSDPHPAYRTAVPTNAFKNIAITAVIGSHNATENIQAGMNDQSVIGVLGGNYNNVGVLQAGSHLRSNVVLLNTQGMNIGVLQPNGAAPVNLLIARLPNGSLLIRP